MNEGLDYTKRLELVVDKRTHEKEQQSRPIDDFHNRNHLKYN
jgi:hypothetical protein